MIRYNVTSSVAFEKWLEIKINRCYISPGIYEMYLELVCYSYTTFYPAIRNILISRYLMVGQSVYSFAAYFDGNSLLVKQYGYFLGLIICTAG